MNKNLITVQLRNQRVSPKKARLVMDLIRGGSVVEIQKMLPNLDNKSAKLADNLLKSALSAAKEKDLNIDQLFISESLVNEGKRLKRFFVKARGRATNYRKRMSHFKISLAKIEKEIDSSSDKIKKMTQKINKGKK